MDAKNKQSLGGHKKAHNFRPSIWNGGWPFRSTESTVHGDHCEWIVAVLPDEPPFATGEGKRSAFRQKKPRPAGESQAKARYATRRMV